MIANEADPARPHSRGLPAPEALSELIGSIYECALDPSKWEAALAAICSEFSFMSGTIGVVRFPGSIAYSASVGLDQEMLDLLASASEEMAALWGGWEQIQRFPLDEPIVHSQMVSRTVLDGNECGAQWVARGVGDAAVCLIARDASMIGNLGLNRHQSIGEIGSKEVDGLRLLTPHFRRAITISNLFDMKTIEAATFAGVLDGFAFGTLLVDAGLGIVHANKVAADLLASKKSIRSEKSVLVLPTRAAQAALERAVHHAAGDDSKLGSCGIGIPAEGEGGEDRIIHVLPLKRGPLKRGAGQRSVAALFVAPAASARVPTDALAILYDLTPAELRVFELVVAGRAPAAVAAHLGIAASTVKTHLIHLFEKTGCRRQGELVKLAASLTMPI